jgi:Rps23 Pro-64 3,4-dihydroxylase Tpa1-like proline 4-hydroxylase
MDHTRFPSACKVGLEQLAVISSIKLDLELGVFPDLDYHAGGMHMLPPGGWLGGHYDAEYHPLFGWERVGSLVWFANTIWEDDWGGQLIIGNEKFTPKFNTAVYFSTKQTWHEVLKVTGPEYRKTLALFFWKKIETKPESGKTNSRFER